jgi:hypothetical protein
VGFDGCLSGRNILRRITVGVAHFIERNHVDGGLACA